MLSVARRSIQYPPAKKAEVVTTFLALGGNKALTAATCKIPEPTLVSWTKTDWWHELVQEQRQQENLTLSTRLKKLMDKSLNLVEDRLENGEWYYDQKKGELIRKPAALRDVHKVSVDLINQRQALEGHKNHIVAEENVMDRLTKLAKQFEDFANKTKIVKEEPDIIDDIEFKEVEPEEAPEEEYEDVGEE
jgi:hypothetical protein